MDYVFGRYVLTIFCILLMYLAIALAYHFIVHQRFVRDYRSMVYFFRNFSQSQITQNSVLRNFIEKVCHI